MSFSRAHARNGQLVTVALQFALDRRQLALVQERYSKTLSFYKWPHRARA